MYAAAGAIIAALTGAVGLWIANRLVGKAAVQTAISDGFSKLMTEMRAELAESKAERNRLQTALTQALDDLEGERRAAAQARQHFRGEIAQLLQIVEGLKRLLKANGVDIPEDVRRMTTDPEHVMIVLREGEEYDDLIHGDAARALLNPVED